MEIYILRHGIAEDAPAGQPDAERALTSDGRKKLRSVLRSAAASGVAPSLILTSPLKRALQTAQIAAEILEYPGELLRTRTLEPNSSPKAIWDEIRVHKDEARILLVGHEPLFGRLMAYLLGSPDLQVEFKKGAMACIELDRFPAEPHGVLRWMLTSKLAGG
ncbi:MAG: phosphohistidine phosphatase SixA [Bryobacteraceae bacterium]|jgi:phosphohistidine phosphatase